MAKITDLAAVDAITGDEFLPIVQRGATKRATMSALRALIVPFLQQWYKGDRGDPGPAGNVAATIVQLVSAALTSGTMIAAYDGTGSTMTWTAGDFTTLAARRPQDYVASDHAPITAGAWVRQGARSLRSTAPGGTPQDAESRMNRGYLTPEDYGAVGYATLAEAMAATTDSTGAMQRLFDECVAHKVIASGGGRWYRVGTVSVPSGLTASDIRTFALPSAQDNAAFFIDGQDAPDGTPRPKRDITLTNCGGHGNRADQTALLTSGGDGQRAVVKVWGRTENVHLLGCFAWHAATDGIWVWHGNVVPAHGTDYCHRDLVIQDPDVQWCGRHGISLSSVYRCRVSANGRGLLTRNGMDLPGATGGGYTDGKYGRRFNGRLYGRPITFESFLDGDGFDTMEWTGLDCRGNVAGALILHVRHQTPCYRLRVTGCQFDDPQGSNGDGAFITTASNAATGLAYAGSDGIVDASFAGNRYTQNAPFLRNIFGLTVNDVSSNVNPAVSVFGFNLAATVESVAFFSCPANRAINGLVSPIAIGAVQQFIGAGWTVQAEPLSFVGFTMGRRAFELRLIVTPDAAELGAFDVLLPEGWTDIAGVRANVGDNDTGLPVVSNAGRSANVGHAVSFSFKASAPVAHIVDLHFTAAMP